MYRTEQVQIPTTFPTFHLVSPSATEYRGVSPSLTQAEKFKKFFKIVFQKGQNRVRWPSKSAPSFRMTTETTLVPSRTIDINGLRLLFSLGRTATYALTYEESFPKAYGITSRHYLWDLDEVEAWLASRKGARPRERRIRPTAPKSDVFDGVLFEKASA